MGDNDGLENVSGSENGSDDGSEATWISAIETMLGAITDKRIKANSISHVPEQLQKSNVKAYKPKVVSMGPLHRGTNSDLLYMEEIKWQCMLSLFLRFEEEESQRRLTQCGEAIQQLDEAVRATYVDRIQFDSRELARIMLLDGCFLLELLISNSKQLNEKLKFKSPATQKKTEEVPSGWELLEKHLKKGEILSDLKLLENQIPLFIIDLLYEKLFGEISTVSDIINGCALFLFGCSSDTSPVCSPNSAHVLELTHWFLTRKEHEEGKPEAVGVTIEPLDLEHEEQSMVIRLGERDDIDPVSSCDKKLSKETKPNLERCAAKLQAERVTITHQQGESSSAETLKGRMPVGVVFGFKKKFEKKFEPVKLEIQPLHVTETTEVQWRNYIALEHTKTTNKKFSEYALLFKGLVCCEDDIELLKTQEVLRVHDTKKWSNEKLKKFIHDIADGIQIDAKVNLEFCEMLKQLNEYKSPAGTRRILLFGHHCRRFLTNTRYTCRDLYGLLKRDHASTPWKTLGVIAAVLLLLLTVAQTVLAAIGL